MDDPQDDTCMDGWHTLCAVPSEDSVALRARKELEKHVISKHYIHPKSTYQIMYTMLFSSSSASLPHPQINIHLSYGISIPNTRWKFFRFHSSYIFLFIFPHFDQKILKIMIILNSAYFPFVLQLIFITIFCLTVILGNENP